jgi:hypothetical protein
MAKQVLVAGQLISNKRSLLIEIVCVTQVLPPSVVATILPPPDAEALLTIKQFRVVGQLILWDWVLRIRLLVSCPQLVPPLVVAKTLVSVKA